MADEFDWQGTLQVGVDTGSCYAMMALDMDGNFCGSYPLNEEGQYKHNLWGGEYAYEGTAMQEDGTEAPVHVDEIANLILMTTDKMGEIPKGVGVRIDQTKYMHINVMKGEKFAIEPEGAEEEVEVTVERAHVLRKASNGAVVVVRGGYIFVALHDGNDPKQQYPDACKAVCHVSYWASGADPEE